MYDATNNFMKFVRCTVLCLFTYKIPMFLPEKKKTKKKKDLEDGSNLRSVKLF